MVHNIYQGVTGYSSQIKFYFFVDGMVDLTNSTDPDEMLHDAAFHLGFHCSPK